MDGYRSKKVAVIVAHPDDETLWAGGTILSHSQWQCFIVCLCRKSDTDRAPKFLKALSILGAEGIMGDLDDGPDQLPLAQGVIEQEILQLMPDRHFDIIITHSINGEYTRHRRHEETGKAVINLWRMGKFSAGSVWAFAYEDGHRTYHPKAIKNATCFNILSKETWLKKYDIMTEIYGFKKNSWEVLTTPDAEAFWQFSNPDAAQKWLENGGKVS